MRGCVFATIVVMLTALSGCGGKEEEKPMPTVTLIDRQIKSGGDTLILRYELRDMGLYVWEGKVIAANMAAPGDPLVANGPVFPKPGEGFIVELKVSKPRGESELNASLRWGPSESELSIAPERPDLFGPAGLRGRADVSEYEDMKLTQILETCGPPNRPVRFDPDKGLDLVKVGYADKTVSVKIWASKKIE